MTVPSSGCRNWPTPLRKWAVATRTSWAIAADRDHTSAAAGWSIWCWERS